MAKTLIPKTAYKIVAIAGTTLAMCVPFTAFAGQWTGSNDNGWKYQKDDGSYASNGWEKIDDVWYYFNADGVILTDTTTPDGYYVDATGAWAKKDANTSTGSGTSTANDVIWYGMSNEEYNKVVKKALVELWGKSPVSGSMYTAVIGGEDGDFIYYNKMANDKSMKYVGQDAQDDDVPYVAQVALGCDWSDMLNNTVNWTEEDKLNDLTYYYYEYFPEVVKSTLDIMLGHEEADRIWPTYKADADRLEVMDGYITDLSLPDGYNELGGSLQRVFVKNYSFGNGAVLSHDFEGTTASGHHYTISWDREFGNCLRIYK